MAKGLVAFLDPLPMSTKHVPVIPVANGQHLRIEDNPVHLLKHTYLNKLNKTVNVDI